ncbi:hypothetical protein [Methanoregula sp.]|uniref:hypothetical protein n=1 Tax=Methanoregula sp. TaxID=2052170 RepID=UPI002B914EBE|nr:hypothetical protein [Methanoregula sp.]HVP95514.1 hypothetical protein [Methanoregula sp.]
MKILYILPVLMAFIVVAGCTSLPGLQQPLTLGQQAKFSNNGHTFEAGIDRIGIQDNQTIVVTLRVVNTGTSGVTVFAYPSLQNPVGESYPGPALYFGEIAPNHEVAQKGAIYLPAGVLDQLSQGSTLKIRFEIGTPVPDDAVWSVDFTNPP